MTVYFIQAASGAGAIKIGYTRGTADSRLRQVGLMSPVALRVIGEAPLGNRTLEAILHDDLAPHRLHGEWFSDCADVRAAIDRVLSQAYETSSTGASIGCRIRDARREAGLTQVALADAIGATAPQVAKWEKNWHTPRPATLRAMSTVLGAGLCA